jgi:tRNA U55 pseudouridine synthase TruB
LNGARNYPDWAQYRINTSLEFAQSPSSQSARLLKIQGVDLYYLVKAGTKVDHNNVRFLESAHLVYENSAIAIYDLARL